MKKIISIALVLLIAAGFCFAADPDASIYLKGTIGEGYLPTEPDTGGSDTFEDGGMTVLITVVENAKDDSAAIFGTGGNKPSIYTSSVEAAKTVKFQESDTGLESLVLAYGAYGNVGSNNNPSISVTVASDGWKLNNAGDPVKTLSLTLNTEPKTQSVFMGAESSDNTITISKNADGATSGIEKVGYTVINWGVVSGQTPTAGDYTATITITVEGDGASV